MFPFILITFENENEMENRKKNGEKARNPTSNSKFDGIFNRILDGNLMSHKSHDRFFEFNLPQGFQVLEHRASLFA